MSNVQYDNPQGFQRRSQVQTGFDLPWKLVRWGLASDRVQATNILLVMVVCAISIGIFFSRDIFFGSNTTHKDRATEWPITAPPSVQ